LHKRLLRSSLGLAGKCTTDRALPFREGVGPTQAHIAFRERAVNVSLASCKPGPGHPGFSQFQLPCLANATRESAGCFKSSRRLLPPVARRRRKPSGNGSVRRRITRHPVHHSNSPQIPQSPTACWKGAPAQAHLSFCVLSSRRNLPQVAHCPSDPSSPRSPALSSPLSLLNHRGTSRRDRNQRGWRMEG